MCKYKFAIDVLTGALMGTQKLLSKSDITLAKRQKLDKQNNELYAAIAWLFMADFKAVEGKNPSTNNRSRKCRTPSLCLSCENSCKSKTWVVGCLRFSAAHPAVR
jgi:hypothetical protein